MPNNQENLAFEVIAADGHVFRVYLDGRTQGFPEGSVVANHVAPRINLTAGLLTRSGDRITKEQRSKILATWGLA